MKTLVENCREYTSYKALPTTIEEFSSTKCVCLGFLEAFLASSSGIFIRILNKDASKTTKKDSCQFPNLSTKNLACPYEYINETEDFDKKIIENKKKTNNQIRREKYQLMKTCIEQMQY